MYVQPPTHFRRAALAFWCLCVKDWVRFSEIDAEQYPCRVLYEARPGNPGFDRRSPKSSRREVVRASLRLYIFDARESRSCLPYLLHGSAAASDVAAAAVKAAASARVELASTPPPIPRRFPSFFAAQGESPSPSSAVTEGPLLRASTVAPAPCSLLVWLHPQRRLGWLRKAVRYDWSERWQHRKSELQRRGEAPTVVLWAPPSPEYFYRGFRRSHGVFRQLAAHLAPALSSVLETLTGAESPAPHCAKWSVSVEAVGSAGIALRLMFARDSSLWVREPDDWLHVRLLQQLLLSKHFALRVALFHNTPHAGWGSTGAASEKGFSRFAGLARRAVGAIGPRWLLERVLGFGEAEELLHADRDRLLCRLAQTEKRSGSGSGGDLGRGGTLLAAFETVLFYGHVNEFARHSPQSALGIYFPQLSESAAVRLLSSQPLLQDRYFFVDVQSSPLVRPPWVHRFGSRFLQRHSFRIRQLLHDDALCQLSPRESLSVLTQQLLNVVNDKQHPRQLAPLRYAAFTSQDFYRLPMHSAGALVALTETADLAESGLVNEGAAWVASAHQTVRSLQRRAAQLRQFARDRLKEVVEGWWTW